MYKPWVNPFEGQDQKRLELLSQPLFIQFTIKQPIMANKSKQLTQEQLIEHIKRLDLEEQLSLCKSLSQLISEQEKQAENEIEAQKEKLELIRNGGK